MYLEILNTQNNIYIYFVLKEFHRFYGIKKKV